LAFRAPSPFALFVTGQGVYGPPGNTINFRAWEELTSRVQQETLMTFDRNVLGLSIAAASLAIASPAQAQYGSAGQAPYGSAAPAPAPAPKSAETAPTGKQPRVSEAARKEIVALQNAVNAKDTVNFPAALAAAQAKAKTSDDKYLIAKLQLKAAADANDDNRIAQAIEAVIASGYDISAESGVLFSNLAKIYYNAKAYDRASTALDRLLQVEPNNVDAIVMQAEARISFSPTDRLLNVLPVFHSFGLTGGTILPLVNGVPLFLYPSPLHYKIIPDIARKWRPSIMFGTDTFLAAYARTAKDDDFSSLRFVVAGAEAVKPETRKTWRERFGADAAACRSTPCRS
jgi:acyl-CoA synthetase (AMP-forming)/AMP-acid ligase II